MDIFASGGGLDNPLGLTFGPDSNLYVSSRNTNQVLRYNGATGAFMGVFASGSGLNLPFGLTFGPDKNLYVDSFSSNQVLRYNGATGAFIDVFASGNGLSNPTYLLFRPSLVPEPGSIALLAGMGMFAAGVRKRRRRAR